MSKKRGILLLFIIAGAFFVSSFVAIPSRLFSVGVARDTVVPPAVVAKDHKGMNIVSNSGVITFTTGLDNDYFWVDSVNKTGYLYLEAKLGTFLNDHVKRVPLNLSIVIDRSGSMKGEKMEFAKKAAKDIVDQLKDEDFVSIVVYDDGVEVMQPAISASQKEVVKARIEQIVPRGATNLWGGSEIGYHQVLEKYASGYVNRVLLISDGLVNQGVTSAKAIRMNVQRFKDDNGITLSTFGVGLDYNEVLMTDMAEAGSGNYYFIDAPGKMASMFDKELTGLLKVAARDAELTVLLPRGVKLQKAFPLKYEEKGNEIRIKFRDLFSEENKRVLLRFQVEDGTGTALKFLSTLSFTDVATGQKKSLSHENILRPVKDAPTYLTYFNKSVLEQVVLFTANENMENAMLEADKGNYEKALQSIEANNLYLKAHAGYVSASASLQKMDSINSSYSTELVRAQTMGRDSVRMLQKASRSKSYEIRNKKQ